ncbi:penicillin-binding protein 2 [Sphingomonas sp. RG327]|uniref:Penicillin-binding protein 2 n=1 Tax=Sphingomonas anseongensis TaxID=2908207 RepID=A0ABT0RD10_9SPHN|nr:penicillin-binding protein 2 [Sphingomonas anseongensis]MCL6678137.1 penicillin-binding protein 2 [Sphingomonas anseongensis]
MKHQPITPVHQSLTFSRRMMVFGGAQAAIGALLVGRLGWLSIAENEHYSLLSESNRVQLIVVPPRRGWLVDRNGVPIAINRSDFRVDLVPQQLEQPEQTLKSLAKILDLDTDAMDRILRDLKQSRGFQPVQVAENVPYEQYAALMVRLPELPGVRPMRGFSRYYPHGPAVAHLVGYVGTPSAEEYEKTKNPLFLTPGFKIGKQGLEKTLEPYVRGTPGGQRIEVTARGKLVKELDPQPDRSGQTVKLTIDAGLQEFAARRMGDNSGALVAMDVASGDLLAYVSMPAFDPNSFSQGIGRTEWKMLSENDHIPLLNKVAQGLYPSGSTIKPAMALAFLKQGIDPNRKFHCSGGVQIGNRYFRDDAAHGTVDMHSAIEHSCNAYFWAMGLKTDPQLTTEMVNYLGYGQEFDLPIPSQRFGTMPSPSWLEEKYHRQWQGYDTANTSIGQGYVLVNPIQLAVMPARIASGTLVQPRLLMGTPRKPIPPLAVDPEHLDYVRKAMAAVVNEHGTAVASKLPLDGVLMAGKTGTAQVFKLGARGHQSNWALRDHALFIGFAPADKPRYAIGCIIEHGGFGASAAAPIVKDTMTYLFDKQKAYAALAPLEEQWGGTLAERNARELNRIKAVARANSA